jgi:hypothetical protein
MSIESDAQHDLELSDEDAEQVAGGREVRKAAHKNTAHKNTATSTSVLVVGTPLTGDSTPNPVEAQAELDSDPDC